MKNLWLRNFVLLALMLAASGLTMALHPSYKVADQRPEFDMQAMVPRAFGEWREEKQSSAQIVDPQTQETLDKTYSQMLSRTYVNPKGVRIMLSLAYGATQRGDIQLHHPEVCYPAQGFEQRSNTKGQLVTPNGVIPVRRLEMRSGARNEPVTYWAMIGDQVALGSVERKIIEMRYGMRGEIADGLLFRISTIGQDSAAEFEHQAAFASDLLGALSPADRHRVSGI